MTVRPDHQVTVILIHDFFVEVDKLSVEFGKPSRPFICDKIIRTDRQGIAMSYNDNYYTNYDQNNHGSSDYSYRGYQDSGHRRYDDQRWAASDYGHGGGYGKGTCLPLPDLCTLVALAGAVAVGAALAVLIPMLLMGKKKRRRREAGDKTELAVFQGTSLLGKI